MIGLLVLVVLVGLNALFVAAEFALVRARRTRLEALGGASAERVSAQLDDINTYLSSCQVGITMASIGIGFIGERAIASLIEPLLDGAVGHALAAVIGFVVAYAVVTSLHITVGEQVPKIYAIQHPERIGMLLSLALSVFTVALKPVIWALSGVSTALLRLLGVSADAAHESAASAEELRAMIEAAGAGDGLGEGEAGMLSGVFRLHEQQAREVMTPAPNVVSADASTSVVAAARLVIDSGHTRLIVTDADGVVGVVHLSQLTEALLDGREATVGEEAKEVPMIPESKPLDELLAHLQRTFTSIAVVLDEYGRMVGIVTIEDIVEEAVGEIRDETDNDRPEIRADERGRWVIPGEASLADLIDAGLDLAVDGEAYNSIGGYVFSELGRLPEPGDEVTVGEYVLRVEAMDDHRIETIVLTPRDWSAGSVSM